MQGYLPGTMIMPATLVLECMAQAAALSQRMPGSDMDHIGYLAGVNGAKFYTPVRTGEELILEAHLLWSRNGFGKIACSASFNDERCAEATITYACGSLLCVGRTSIDAPSGGGE